MTKKMNKEFPNYTFGVELETFGVNGAVLSWALRRAGLNVVGAYAEDGGNASSRRAAREQGAWDLGEDGSIRGTHPIEIRSPVLSGRKGLKEIEKVCRVLHEVGSEVNTSCGLHVHIGITNAAAQGMKPFTTPEILTILKRYHQWEKSIDGFLQSGRRENKNQYCKSLDRLLGVVEAEVARAQGQPVPGPVMVDAEWGRQNSMVTRGCDCADCQTLVVDQENRRREDQHRRTNGRRVDLSKPETLAQFGDHYDKVSVQPLTKYGTIEFRQHHGSIDAKEITNWIRFLMNHIEVSRRLYAASEARKAALKEAEALAALAPAMPPGEAQAPEAHKIAQAPRIPKDRDILMGITPSARKHFKGQTNRFSPRPRKPRKAAGAPETASEAPPAVVRTGQPIRFMNLDVAPPTHSVPQPPPGVGTVSEQLNRLAEQHRLAQIEEVERLAQQSDDESRQRALSAPETSIPPMPQPPRLSQAPRRDSMTYNGIRDIAQIEREAAEVRAAGGEMLRQSLTRSLHGTIGGGYASTSTTYNWNAHPTVSWNDTFRVFVEAGNRLIAEQGITPVPPSAMSSQIIEEIVNAHEQEMLGDHDIPIEDDREE